jgi:hypothetical protein
MWLRLLHWIPLDISYFWELIIHSIAQSIRIILCINICIWWFWIQLHLIRFVKGCSHRWLNSRLFHILKLNRVIVFSVHLTVHFNLCNFLIKHCLFFIHFTVVLFWKFLLLISICKLIWLCLLCNLIIELVLLWFKPILVCVYCVVQF